MGLFRRDLDELEVRAQIDHVMRQTARLFAIENGRRIRLNEVIRLREFTNLLGLIIAYSAGSFLSLDRIRIVDSRPIRYKRIINRLETPSGQISAALLLELLRLRDKTRISKYTLIQTVQEKYFRNKPIGTKDITESLNRMLRKTMCDYFWFEGRVFRKSQFDLRIIEVPKNIPYELAKLSVDNVIQL